MKLVKHPFQRASLPLVLMHALLITSVVLNMVMALPARF